ncbi:MAG: (2Fe-2S) ferredoxin domain-containing protein [bacterium]
MASELKRGGVPYRCLVLVCMNDRGGERKSCADGGSVALRAALKAAVGGLGYPKDQVRVSGSLCLGLCAAGPNVLISPQQIWFSEVRPEHVDAIVDTVRRIMEEEQ